MKPVDFHWFSGTGNTLLVVQRMTEVFRTAGVPVTLRALDKANPAEVNLEHTLGLAFPVAAFSTYPLVWHFIEALPPANGTPVFMVDTRGSFSGLLVGPLRQLLQQKGYVPLAAREINMPGNYLRIKPREKCRKTIAQGLAKAEAYARDLLAERGRWRRLSPLPYSLVRWFWQHVAKSFAKADAKFRVNAELCTKCGRCAKLCPIANIVLGETGPAFQGKCQQCQRCIAFCPTRAIIGPGAYASGLYRAVEAQVLLDHLHTSS